MSDDNSHNLIPAEVREQVYETLRKHCSGYANANEISQQHYSQPSSHIENGGPYTSTNAPMSTNTSSFQPQGVNNPRSAATNITGISGFASPLNVRRQQQQVATNELAATSKADAMALYAKVDPAKKKKNRDSGGGSR